MLVDMIGVVIGWIILIVLIATFVEYWPVVLVLGGLTIGCLYANRYGRE